MAEKENTKRNRREEILQALAQMLESSDGSQRITTAKLAANVGVSEAALYRHFPSKTRMFDSLIEFIEDSLMSRINLILQDEKETFNRLRLILLLVLGFAERNPGLTRIMTGHALMLSRIAYKGGLTSYLNELKCSYAKSFVRKSCVMDKALSMMKRYWPPSCWHFAKGCFHASFVLNSVTAQHKSLIPAGH